MSGWAEIECVWEEGVGGPSCDQGQVGAVSGPVVHPASPI